MGRKSKSKLLESDRHPAAVAMDRWLESAEGMRCTDDGARGIYLRNRLMRAFQAGYFSAAEGKSE